MQQQTCFFFFWETLVQFPDHSSTQTRRRDVREAYLLLTSLAKQTACVGVAKSGEPGSALQTLFHRQ